MGLTLYRTLQIVLFPLIWVYMVYRRLKGREDPTRFHERLGRPTIARPEGPLVWIHGASVGEVLSLLPVLRALRAQRPEANLLLTTGTIGGMKMLEKSTSTLEGTGQTILQFVPLDLTGAVGRFLTHWKPDLSVFAESEFWPNMLSMAPNPILLNGRISDRSWPRYQKKAWFFKPLISRFTHVLAQRETDAERLKALGANNVQVGGNLKFDADLLPVDALQLQKFRDAIGDRPTVVFASTHTGEEEQAATLHLALKPHLPDLLTIVVPRHPHRGTQAAGDLLRHVRAVHRRGTGDMPGKDGPKHTEIYVADTLGEMGLWLRLAHVAIIGGSLVKHGGHNPLEPLKLGIPTLTGPHMFNFQDMVPPLTEAGLLTIAKDTTDLGREILHLLNTPETYAAQKAKLAAEMPKLGGSSRIAANLLATLLPKA